MGRQTAIRLAVSILAAQLIILRPTAAGPIDQSCLELLRSQGKESWEAYRRNLRGKRLEYEWYRIDSGGKRVLRARNIYYLHSDGEHEMYIVVNLSPENVGGEARSVRNRRYAFDVGYYRNNDSENKLVSVDATGKQLLGAYQSVEQGAAMAEAPIRCGRVRLERMLNDEEFELVSLSRVTHRECTGGQGLRLESRFRGQAITSGAIPGTVYWSVIDQGADFLVRECGAKSAQRESSSVLTLAKDGEGSFYLQRLITTLRPARSSANQDSQSTELMAVSPPTREELPKREYFLGHYGFSESLVPSENQRSWVKYFYVVFGLLGIATAVYLFFGWRRRQKGHIT